MRRHVPKNTNNSATKVYFVDNERSNDTGRVALTSEPELYATMQHPKGILRKPRPHQKPYEQHNVGKSDNNKKLNSFLRTAFGDNAFREKYNYQSLFLIGAGSYGHVFRVVSNATGSTQNPVYNEDYVKFLQSVRRTKSRKKLALLDSYRDSLCLDLVAMKVEALEYSDIEFNSTNKIQLLKEFCVLTELFRNQYGSNSLVGFPMPIEFGFLGKKRMAKDLKKVLVFDMYGRPSNYSNTFLGESTILNLAHADVTNTSYLTMELVGPNLDEWRQFFATSYSDQVQQIFSVQTTLKLMDQVLCRLLIMHRKNMVHLDLKPDNLCMGIGKMTNTVYLLDYGLSRICSEERPNITMGSRRYMSVGVLNMEPTNYMMDIESWFYVLIVLLSDFVPWTDQVITSRFSEAESENKEHRMVLVSQLKKDFWGDRGGEDDSLIQQVIDKIWALHKIDVPDISTIIMDIYLHIKRMRKDFYRVSSFRMHSDIMNDESDLFKRYHTLRKLLLFPYDCQFTDKGSCFACDKDLIRKQEKRQDKYPMLVYAENGRNWHWDWDVWFNEKYPPRNASNGNFNRNSVTTSRHLRLPHSAPTISADCTEEAEDEDEDEGEEVPEPVAGIPSWMRHYLARVMGSNAAASPRTASHTNSPRPEPESIAVA